MVKTFILPVMLLVLCCAAFAGECADADCSQKEHTQWVASVLRETYALKAGMTRKDLLSVYTEEGGIPTRTQQTYGLKGCPYIHVDVLFAPVGDARNLLVKNLNDKILNISKPYLDYAPTD